MRGRLHSQYWSLVTAGALLISGASFLVHEQNGWLFARSAFLHHSDRLDAGRRLGVPLGAAFRRAAPRGGTDSRSTFVAVAVMLFSDRDVAPIFGHLSELAGGRP